MGKNTNLPRTPESSPSLLAPGEFAFAAAIAAAAAASLYLEAMVEHNLADIDSGPMLQAPKT
jgi:hypothetical protein